MITLAAAAGAFVAGFVCAFVLLAVPVSHQRKPSTPIKHGTLYGYKRQLCRCDDCRAANAEHSRRTTNHDRHRASNRRWYATRGKEQRHA